MSAAYSLQTPRPTRRRGAHVATVPEPWAPGTEDTSVRIPLYTYRNVVVGYARADEADADTLSAYRWNLANDQYAVASVIDPNDDRRRVLGMHRLVLGLYFGDARQGDHINNRDTLDNRRSNLRIVTAGQNGHNTSGRALTSRYRGVCWATGAQKWLAQCKVAGVKHNLGLYDDEFDAAKVAARFRVRHLTHTIEDPALLEDVAA